MLSSNAYSALLCMPLILGFSCSTVCGTTSGSVLLHEIANSAKSKQKTPQIQNVDCLFCYMWVWVLSVHQAKREEEEVW